VSDSSSPDVPRTQGIDPAARAVSVRRWFRIFAFAEAVSWGALLVAMFFKWVVQEDPNTGLEGGVPIVGPIHGVLFLAYCALAVVAWSTFRWNLKTLAVALLAAVPPFFTVWFEVAADRRGLLTSVAEDPDPAPGTSQV
jgi:integral membrane protein